MNQKEIDDKALTTVLDKCSFDSECDFCIEPNNGTFCRNMGSDDDYYWICGKCFIEIANKYPQLDGMKLSKKIDDEFDKLSTKLPF